MWPGDGGYVYIPGVSKPNTGSENFDFLRYFKYGVTGGIPNLSVAAKSTEEFGFGSGAPIVTSNGTTSGSAVLWITHCPYTEPFHCEEKTKAGEGAELWAYNAVPVAGKPSRLWKAPIGLASKFVRPEAGCGHIYVGNHEGSLFGYSGPPTLAQSAPSVEFGSVPVGGQGVTEVTFTNTGGPLKVTSVRLPSAPFSVTGLPNVGATLAPCQVVTARVTFNPTAPGGSVGSLGFTTGLGESNVIVSGSAPAPTPPAAAGTPIAILASSGGAGTLGASESRPVIDHLKLAFLASKSSRHKRKAKLSFTLSSAAKVQIVIYRRVVSHHCARHARTCFRYVATSIKLTLTGHAGANQFTIDLTRLGRGTYRLNATPIARAAAATPTRSVSFTVH